MGIRSSQKVSPVLRLMWGSGDIGVQASEHLEMSAKDDRSGLPRPCHTSAHSSRIIPEIYLSGGRAKNPILLPPGLIPVN